jgi:esterase/lipase superfamily enzyme
MDVTVYFASNRQVSDPNDWTKYGTNMAGAPTDPTAVTYGAAFVQDADLATENSGRISAIEKSQQGGFSPGLADDILGSGKNVLVFIHGFANSFLDGIARAAYNQTWFAASGIAAADTSVIAFCWPSLGELLPPPPHLLPQDYWTDQVQAGRSGRHIAGFLAGLRPLLRQTRQQGAPVSCWRTAWAITHCKPRWSDGSSTAILRSACSITHFWRQPTSAGIVSQRRSAAA